MPRLCPYPRGFVLGRAAFDPALPPGHYRTTVVAGAWHFAHDPIREPAVAQDPATGRFLLVHGTCFPVGEEPVEDVAGWLLTRLLRDREAFLDGLDVLAGRHVVITGDSVHLQVHQDAVGARSVYYSPAAELISSHARLIHDLTPHSETAAELIPATPTASWNLTPWAGILALNPNHALDTRDWTTNRFFPRRPNQYAEWSTERKLEAVEVMWQRGLDTLITGFDDVVVSVSGGADSRVSLALARKHLPAMHGFTYTAGGNTRTRWGRRLSKDERIVRQLLPYLPLRHEFFSPGDSAASLTEELRQLLTRNSLLHHGHWLIPHYNQHFPGEDVAHVRSNAFEIGQAVRNPTEDNDTIDALESHYARRANPPATRSATARLNPAQRSDFHNGVSRLGYDQELHGYHRLDLFHWEVRSGRWLAEVLNETDVSFDTYLPINIRSVQELLLSFPATERRRAFAYEELINRNFPVLNLVGKNDDRNLYEQKRDAELARRGTPLEGASAWLEQAMEIVEADGRVLEEDVRPAQSDLYLPQRHLVQGRRACRRIGHLPVPGSLRLSFWSPYAFPQSMGKFEYQVVVSGEIVARVDGAAWGDLSWITVHNLSAEDTLDIRVVAGMTTDRVSWSNATRAHISDLHYTPREPDGPLQIASSNPYAEYRPAGGPRTWGSPSPEALSSHRKDLPIHVL